MRSINDQTTVVLSIVYQLTGTTNSFSCHSYEYNFTYSWQCCSGYGEWQGPAMSWSYLYKWTFVFRSHQISVMANFKVISQHLFRWMKKNYEIPQDKLDLRLSRQWGCRCCCSGLWRSLVGRYKGFGVTYRLHFNPENGGDKFLRNVGIYLQDYTESQPRRQQRYRIGQPVSGADIWTWNRPNTKQKC
jgi:hypothetical protein